MPTAKADIAGVPPSQRDHGKIVTAALANEAKNVIAHQGAGVVKQQMRKFYQVMRLMDAQGVWAKPEIAAIGDQLLPHHLTLQSINNFIDDARRVNEQNRYLMDFAGALQSRPLGEVIERLKVSQNSVIPEVLGFAMVLQNLTAAFHGNIELVDKILSHWEQEGEKVNLRKQLGLTFRLKFESIYTAFKKALQSVHSGEVPGDFGNFHLPFNILQAAALDFFKGQISNAAAGYVLARHYPGNTPDPGTGAGPVHFANGGKVIKTGLPLGEDWADLYQTWNLAFGAQFGSFPLYICKLIIPQVADYHDDPQLYVWDRMNALMIYLFFASFAIYDQSQGNAVDSAYYRDDWSAFAQANLHKLWGTVNHASATDYKEKVESSRIR